MEQLFSYGTLREEAVQRAVFGRRVDTIPDVLAGYRLVTITITDRTAIAISGRAEHRILEPTGQAGNRMEGAVLDLTLKELALADAYEDPAYRRARVNLVTGVDAWVYVRA